MCFWFCILNNFPNDDTTKLEDVGRKTDAGASAHLPAQVNRDAVLHSEGVHEGGEDQISSNIVAVHTNLYNSLKPCKRCYAVLAGLYITLS